MIPVLFKEDEQIFTHNGIGALYESLSCDVIEEENGAFTMELEYPVDGEWFSELKDFRIIQAKPNDIDDPHNFRIYEIEKSIDELTVFVRANTRTNDLGNNLITNYVGRDVTPQQAMNGIKNKLAEPTNFDLISDIQTKSSVEWVRLNPLNAIVGTRGSMVDIWGGEIKRTNTAIHLYSRRGRDGVATIRPGKNIEGLNMTVSTAGLVTKILPTYSYRPVDVPKYHMVTLKKDGTKEKRRVQNSGSTTLRDDITVLGNVVSSQYVNNYPMNYWLSVDYNDDEELRETVDTFIDGKLKHAEESPGIVDMSGFDRELENFVKTELDKRAKQYFTHRNPGVDKPTVRIKVNMLQLSDSPDWEEFKDLERIGLTDTLDVWVEKYDIDVEVRVTTLTYDSIAEQVRGFNAGSDRAPRQSVIEKKYDDLTKATNDYITSFKNGVQNIMRNTADGLNRKFEGYTEPPAELSSEGDIWFKEIGEGKVEIWIHDGVYWQPLMTEDFGKKLEADMLEQQKDIDAAKEAADEAVEQINTAVVNAGFTSLNETISSVQSISNQAQINSGAAINNALEAMQQASQAIDNTGSLNIRVDEVEGILSVKADKQMVDVLTGVVDVQGLDIQANAQGLALKANQSTVDTLAGTVSSLGANFDVVAGQVNSRVWNTDIETAIDGIEVGGRNHLRNTEVGNSEPISMFGHPMAGPSFSFSTGTEYYTLESRVSSGEAYYRALAQGTVPSELSGTWTFSGEVLIPEGTSGVPLTRTQIAISSPAGWVDSYGNGERPINATKGTWTKFIHTFEMPKGTQSLHLGIKFAYNTQEVGDKIHFKNFKLERGNKATDWTPAPEDTTTLIDHIETQWTQTFDTFSQTVSGIDGRVTSQKQTIDSISSTVSAHGGRISTVEQTASGLQTTVASKASQTQVTQLSNLLSSTVEDVEGNTTQISQLSDNINLRVKKGDVVSQLNIDANRTLISSSKILLNANTVSISGTAWMDGAVIANASIDGAKIADATIGSAKIANLDVSKISGNTTEFVRSAWNAGLDNVTIDASGMYMTGSGAWRRTYLSATGFDLYAGSGGSNKAGAIGYFKEHYDSTSRLENYINDIKGSKHYVGIGANNTHIIAFGYQNDPSISRKYSRALTIDGDTGIIRVFRPIYSGGSDYGINLTAIDWSPYYGTAIEGSASGILLGGGGTYIWDNFAKAWDNYNMTTRRRIGFYGDSGIQTLTTNKNMEIWAGGSSVIFYTGTNNRKFIIGNGVIEVYTDLNMNNYRIFNQSDSRLKTNIAKTNDDSLEKITNIEFVDFNWLASGKDDFGIVAQQVQRVAPELIAEVEDGYLGINSTRLNMMTTHAVKELALRELNTNKVASQALQLVESIKSEIDELREENRDLRNRIEELESVV